MNSAARTTRQWDSRKVYVGDRPGRYAQYFAREFKMIKEAIAADSGKSLGTASASLVLASEAAGYEGIVYAYEENGVWQPVDAGDVANVTGLGVRVLRVYVP